MRAAVYEGKQRFDVREVPTPDVGPGQILVRVGHSAICGTDVHGFQADVVPPGSIMGHEFSGTVAQLGEGVTGWTVGDRLTGGGGSPPPGVSGEFFSDPRLNFRTHGWQSQPAWARAYAEYVQMEAWLPIPIPEGLSDVSAAMGEPCAAAVHAVRRSRLQIGNSVGVIGAGPLGLFVMQIARAGGADNIVVSEPAEARREAAVKLGADAVIDPLAEDPVDRMVSLTSGLGPDIVFECAGGRLTLHQALDMVRPHGQVVLVALAWEPTPVVSVDWIARYIDLTTTFGHTPEDWRIALSLMRSKRVDLESLLPESSFIPLDGIQAAFDALVKPTTELKIFIRP